jgi:hypothetical protein
MQYSPLISRSLAATSIFLYSAAWCLLLVGTPLLIEKLLPPGHPRLDEMDMMRFTTFVVFFNGIFALAATFIAGRVANGNRVMIGALGIVALVVSYRLFEGAPVPWSFEEHITIGTLRLWHIMLLTVIGLLLLTCSVTLTWRRLRDGKSAMIPSITSGPVRLCLRCLLEPERQGRILLGADLSQKSKIQMAVGLWGVSLFLTLVSIASLYFRGSMNWFEPIFLSGILFAMAVIATVSTWILDRSMRCLMGHSNLADTGLSFAVTVAPIAPMLGFALFINQTDLLGAMMFFKKLGLSPYTIITDKYAVGLRPFDSLEELSSIGIEIAGLVLLWRVGILVDLLAPLYRCDRGRLFPVMGLTLAVTIGVSLLFGHIGLYVQDAYLISF